MWIRWRWNKKNISIGRDACPSLSQGEWEKRTRNLSCLVDNRKLNYKLDEPERPGEPIKSKRLTDTESDDFGVGGDSFKGRAQIHKSSPSKILGTFQTGKTNMTFELNSQKDNNSWNG